MGISMRPDRPARFKLGDLRPSQLLFVFGVGGIVDLRHVSAMVMGLDDWDVSQCPEIAEPRLLQAIQMRLAQVRSLRTPPVVPEGMATSPTPDPELSTVGVPVATFPRWAMCPECRYLAPLHPAIFRLREGRYRPEETCYVHQNCNKASTPRVVPARFVVACNRGHLDDFPWRAYVHGGDSSCPGPLLLNESGVTGEAGDVFLVCKGCDKGKSMASAFDPERRRDLPRCRGRRPHLRDFEERGCGDEVRTLMLGATNTWFPISFTALSLPVSTDALAQLVEEAWPALEKAKNVQNIELLLDVQKLPAKMAKYRAEEIWAAVERRRAPRGDGEPRPVDLKTPEWEAFSRADPDFNSDDFKAEPERVPEPLEEWISQVVKISRLREVRALLGFTRLDSPGTFDEDPETPVVWAPISRRPPAWVPAAQTRGEGLFLRLNPDALAAWEGRVAGRSGEFLESHTAWRQMRHIEPPAAHDSSS
jgi:hypothetical protein